MRITKLPLRPTKDFLDGFTVGTNNTLAMILTVFREHPELSKEQIEQYIKDNL